MLAEFFEWASATSLFDCTRDTLGQQQPPRDDIPIPSVDDCINVLIEEVAFDDGDTQIILLKPIGSRRSRLGNTCH